MADVNNDKQEHHNGVNGHADQPNYFDQIAGTKATSDCDKLKECFEHFDVDGDGFLNMVEFTSMIHSLFKDRDKSHDIPTADVEKMFKLMDENQDDLIDEDEFQVIWYHWFKQVLDPVTAFVLVDVQNDFISGSLSIRNCPAGHDGAEVVPVINKLIDSVKFNVIVYTLDWHPSDHISFIDNVSMRKLHETSPIEAKDAKTLDNVVFEGPPLMEQKLWPAHCVQNTWGAKVHEDVRVVDNSFTIKKGTNPDVDSYSAFWDNMKLSKTKLEEKLTEMGVTDVYVCGIAYDVCVGSTAKHALEHGFRTILVDDASRGVSNEDIEAMKKTLLDHGAVIVNSENVKGMVEVMDRRPEIGIQAALNVALARRLVNADKSSK